MIATGVIAVAAAATVLTGGAATVAYGLSEVGESFTDHNVIRDSMMDGDEKLYSTTKDIVTTTAQVGTVLLGGYMQTGRFKASKVGKEFLGKNYTRANTKANNGSYFYKSKDGHRTMRYDNYRPHGKHFNLETWKKPFGSPKNKKCGNIHQWFDWFKTWE